MTNKLWAVLFCFHLLALTAVAQSSAKRQVVLALPDGGFVAFRSETSAIDNRQPAIQSQFMASLIYSRALAGENKIIHRVLTDANQRAIFGYDLLVSADPVTRKFSLIVLPADEAFRRSFLKETAAPIVNDTFATFPKSAAPQTLDDGDAVSLELLINHQAGVKIVDVVKVTFDRTTLRDSTLEGLPRDFTLDAVSLSVKGYELLRDGKVVAKSKSAIGQSGSLLWFYVPDRGRFIFSLVPREGYSFQKSGVLDGNKIEFIADGEHYEWLSGSEILPNGGTWNLWVLHDADYTPLFATEKSLPHEKKPGLVRKLEGVLEKGPIDSVTLSVMGSRRPRPKVSTPDLPRRVMVGGADSIEHLIPKGP
jgi:hypothetical protein